MKYRLPAGSACRLRAPRLPVWILALWVAAGVTELAAQTKRTMRAIALPEGERIVMDGVLNEAAWQNADVARDFVQQEPHEGTAATEATEVRILFDHSNLYVGVTCAGSAGGRIVTTSLARDFDAESNDFFALVVDPFDDDRNGFLFAVTPDEALRDLQVTNDGANANENWDGVWDARTEQNHEGWTAELVIPFKTLRFSRNLNHRPWGLNFSRRIRGKNEITVWNLVPRRYRLSRVSMAGELTGLTDIEPGRNLKVIPYGAFRLVHTRSENKTDPKGGVDLKYSLATNLTMDLTLNTDFSEVEIDRQQVNLTRFPLFFPEKRVFFLESADIFHFGVRPAERVGVQPTEEHLAFFSRRIGLSPEGQPLPIWGGARLTGKTGPFSLGLLHVSTREEVPSPGTDYTVARVKRDLFRKSDFGFLAMNRSGTAGDYTRVAGTDINLNFRDRLSVTSFLMKSFSPGISRENHAAKLFAGWSDRFLELAGSYIDIGENFDDSMSFIPRKAIRMFRGSFDLHPRPKIPGIREIQPLSSFRYYTNRSGQLEYQRIHNAIWLYFNDGSRFHFIHDQDFERLERPFTVHPGVKIPAGDYHIRQWGTQYFHDPSATLSWRAAYIWGSFWGGKLKTLNSGITLRMKPRFFAETSYERNQVRLPQGNFTTDLASLRLHHGFNTRHFVDMLAQYRSRGNLSVLQVRYNFLHRPLSDLFLVFHEQRGRTAEDRLRAVTMKFTRLFDF